MTNLKDIASDAREAELAKLFSNSPAQTDMEVRLPSKGKFYRSMGPVKVSPLLFEDEQKILLSKNKNINPINEIIAKCVHGINIHELLTMDKLYLLIKIKEISYGPEYKFGIICPICQKHSEVKMDVREGMRVVEIPDDLEDPRDVFLPNLKVNAKVRFPRNNEEHYITDSELMANNIFRFVISINNIEDPVFIAKAIKKMHIMDIKTLIKEINRSEFGLETSFQFNCPHCLNAVKMGVPFDANFFSVS